MYCAVSLAAIIRLHCLDFLINSRIVDLLLLHVVVVGVFFSQCLLSRYTDYIGAIHLYVCVSFLLGISILLNNGEEVDEQS
jgi:hypothetical protein